MLFVIVGVLVLTVPLAGGKLLAFASVRFRRTWILFLAFAIQFAIFKLWPESPGALHPALYLLSYALGAMFLVSNRRLPGLWLVGLGALMNGLAIAANGGVMPGDPGAFRAAGLTASPDHFVNSRAVEGARLLFLGDVFAVPEWLPFHNVFSIGDLCIVMGAFVGLHRLSGSRLLPSGTGQFTVALRERDFRRLWLAQAVSNQGDWVYSLGVVSSLARSGAGTSTLAALVVMQAAPRALASAFGGPLADRVSRKGLMIFADLMRAAAVGTLLLADRPSLAHLYTVAALLGLFGAVFQPSLQASIPNVVPPERLVAANALVSVTFQLAVMTGPLLGALLVDRVGLGAAFAINALSFVLSAALIARLHLSGAPSASTGAPSPVHALREGARYALATPVVRGVLMVTGLIMFAAAIRGPLEPLFLLRVLDAHPATLGLPAAVWGLGMLLGSSAAPAAARAWSNERLLTFSVAMVGITVLAASQAAVLSSLLCLWVVAGSGNAVGTIAYHSLLQQRTPDKLRGRIMAASEMVLDLAYLIGVTAGGWLGDHIGLRYALAAAGAVFLLAAVTSRLALGRGERATAGPGVNGQGRTGGPLVRTRPRPAVEGAVPLLAAFVETPATPPPPEVEEGLARLREHVDALRAEEAVLQAEVARWLADERELERRLRQDGRPGLAHAHPAPDGPPGQSSA